MGTRVNFSQREISKIEEMLVLGLQNNEIAEAIGRNVGSLSVYIRKHYGGNENYIKKITKHRHLREDVFKYFVGHTMKECMDKFGITQSEFKSIMTVSYKAKNLAHIRKDKIRRRDAWSTKELIFLIKHSGIMPRSWINEKLKRGNSERVIKEKLNQLGISSKNINGLSLKQYRSVFKISPNNYIQTKAGPTGFEYKITPWVTIEEEIELGKIDCNDCFRFYVKTMALFQRWIIGDDPIMEWGGL